MASPPAPPSISEPPQVFPETTALSEPTEDEVGTDAYSDPESGEERSIEFHDLPSEERQNRTRRGKRNARSLGNEAGSAVPDTATERSSSEQAPPPRAAARPLRLNPALAALEQQSEQAMDEGRFDQALAAIETALAIPERTRFDTARLWRTKARILTLMGRETDAQHARETAAKLDPTR